MLSINTIIILLQFAMPNYKKLEPLPQIQRVEMPVIAKAMAYSIAHSTPHSMPQAVGNWINVGERNIPLEYHPESPGGVSPSAGVANLFTGANFIYGHNTADVFGNLVNLPIGFIVTISLEGNTNTYEIIDKAYNSGGNAVDSKFVFPYGSNKYTLMTCAPWVVDGAVDNSRLGVIIQQK